MSDTIPEKTLQHEYHTYLREGWVARMRKPEKDNAHTLPLTASSQEFKEMLGKVERDNGMVK